MERSNRMGIVNVYKEKGWTSFDVVAKLRGMLRIKKIGHTGTLDPAAEGVLPVCISKATKVVDLITDKQKTYKTTCHLGIATDTQDATGTTLEEKPVTCNEEQVLECINGFVGDILQVPPMYSALKVNGKKLYQLAREGKTVERKARPITVYAIEDIEVDLPYVHFSVTCSKGTYIRTICHDIGQKLGCGGHMKSLIRTKVGHFTLENSLTIDQISDLIDKDQFDDIMMPVDAVFAHLQAVHVKKAFNKWLYNGNKVPKEQLIENISLNEETYRVYDEDDYFMGVYKPSEDTLRPLKLFI